MFFHPSYLMFWVLLMCSIWVVTASGSILWAWAGMELSLVGFAPLLMLKKKSSSESVMKYFLVQCLGSVFFLVGLLLTEVLDAAVYLMAGAILMKAGGAPLHQWVPALSEGTPWLPLLTMLTVQKINPLFVLSGVARDWGMALYIGVIISLSGLVGSLGGLSQGSTRKILTYSSINQMSWMLTSIILVEGLWETFFLFYALIFSGVVLTFYKDQIFYLSQILSRRSGSLFLLCSFSLLSLGGLPPFSGFFPKIMIVNSLMSFSYFIVALLLLGSFLALVFYARLSLYFFLRGNWSTNTASKSNKYFLNWVNLAFSWLPIIFLF